MRKWISVILAIVVLMTFSACGSNNKQDAKPDESPAVVIVSPPVASPEPSETPEPPPTPTPTPELQAAVLYAGDVDDNGYFHQPCQESGIYDFEVKNPYGNKWKVFILNSEFTEGERYIAQAYSPSLEGSGSLEIQNGQWLYIYCSANSWTGEAPSADSAITWVRNPEKKSADVTATVKTERVELKITKDPTGEILEEGGTAYFVARAENAETMEWEFADTVGVTHTCDDTVRINAGLKVNAVSGDTLQISDVPLSLSGWKCRVVFKRGEVSLPTAYADITVKTTDSFYYPAYSSVIDNYRSLASGGSDPYGLSTDMDISGLMYCLEDVDYDGTPELLIGRPDTSVVYSLFRLSGNTPVKVFSSSSRNRYMRATVGFIHEGSSGADSSVCYLENYQGGMLTVTDGIYTTAEGMFHITGNTAESGLGEPVSQEQFASYQAWYESAVIIPAYAAFK